jgi:hypothetical protein
VAETAYKNLANRLKNEDIWFGKNEKAAKMMTYVYSSSGYLF